MSQQFLTDATDAGTRAPAQVLIPQLSLQSMFWRPKFQTDSEWLSHVPAAFWLVEAHQPQRVVELGCDDGVSYFAFCQAIDRLRPFAECLGFTAKPPSEALVEYNEAQYQEFSRLHQASQEQALASLEAGSVDLLHITAGVAKHVAARWEQWQAKLSPSAVVVISEANGDPEASEPAGLFRRLSEAHPAFLFEQGRGLGLIGVGEHQGDTLARLFGFGPREPAYRLVQQVFARLGLACASSQRLHEVTQEGQEHQRALAYKDKKIEGLRATIAELKQQLARAEAEVDPQAPGVRQELEGRQARIETLSRDLAQSEAQRRSLDQARQAAEAERDAIKQQQVRLQDDLQLRFDELAQITELLHACEAELQQYREHKTVSQQAYQDLEQRLRESDNALGVTKHQAQVQQKHHQEQQRQWEQRNAELEARLEQQAQQLTHAQQQVKTLETRAQAAETAQQRADTQRREKEKQLASLQQRLEQLSQENTHLHNEQEQRFQELAELTQMLEAQEQRLASPDEAQSKPAPSSARGLSSLGRRLQLRGKEARKLKRQIRLIEESGLFDAAWYLARNADVKASNMPAAEHFLRFGGAEGRSPGPRFDSQWYLEQYPDVAESGMNPLLHYVKFGQAEDRWPTPYGQQGEHHGH